MKQRTFFDSEYESDMRSKRGIISATDPNAIESDSPRLSGQNAAILDRLKQGSATNKELAAISLKYTSRVSDLRAAGYEINCQRGANGLNVYSLRRDS